MSYTQNDHLFGGLGESGAATTLKALFGARPRYINYATPGLAPANTVNVTQIPAGPFGLQYSIGFAVPDIDFFPPNAKDPVPPAAGQLTVGTKARVSVGASASTAVSVELDIYIVCQPYVVAGASGSRSVGLKLIGVTVTNVQPPGLAAVLGAFLEAFIQQTLGSIQIPFGAFTLPPVTLVLKEGPTAETDRLDVRGDIQ